MDEDDFNAEWERAALTWGKDPDTKLMSKIRGQWAKRMRRERMDHLRIAIDRLSAEQPRHFPTLGQIRNAVAEVKGSFQQRSQLHVDAGAPVAGDEYMEWSAELEELAAVAEHEGRAAWGLAYRHLAAHWRMNAVRMQQGRETVRAHFSEILRESGVLQLGGREMPTPEPRDYDGDERYR